MLLVYLMEGFNVKQRTPCMKLNYYYIDTCRNKSINMYTYYILNVRERLLFIKKKG